MSKTKMITTQAHVTSAPRASTSMQDQVNEAVKQNAPAFMHQVSQAIKNILVINATIADLSDACNEDILRVVDVVINERTLLITTLPAYYQADKVLNDLMPLVSERVRYTTQASLRSAPKV